MHPVFNIIIYLIITCMNIFVGSLPFSLEESELQEFFEEYGEVTSAKIITDKFQGEVKALALLRCQ